MYLYRKIRGVALEFKPSSAGAHGAWKKVLAALSSSDKRRGLGSLFHWAIRNGKTPGNFTPEDLDSFCEYSCTVRKQCYSYLLTIKSCFLRWVFEKKLETEFPSISPTSKPRYGIPMQYWPQPIRNQAERFLHWLGAPISENRGRPPLRPASVSIIKRFLQQFIGFLCLGSATEHDPAAAGETKPGLREAQSRLHALLQDKSVYRKYVAEAEDLVRVLLEGVTGLEQVLVEKSVRGYFNWLIAVRGTAVANYKSSLAIICEAFRKYPHKPLCDADFGWMRQVIRDLPKCSRTQIEERKEQKWITYEVFQSIAERLARLRNRGCKTSPIRAALLFRNELIFRLLAWVPFRRANISGCKLGSSETGGNIFKAKLPQRATFLKPNWVMERLKTNPDALFWQVLFREHETKNGEVLYGILPKALAELFEDYLEHFRPTLCKRADSGALFPAKSGKTLTSGSVYKIVRDTAFRFTGKPVNIHLVRDIAAVGVLDESDPDASLFVASRLLGHKGTGTAANIYLSKFNLSHAVRKFEELRERRKREEQAEPTDSNPATHRLDTAVSLARELAEVLDGMPGFGELQSKLAKLTLDPQA